MADDAPPSGDSGQRCYRPVAGRPIAWPDDFGTRFTLFVDTEEEFDWAAPLRADARSTSAMAALPDGQRRLRDAGASPVYLIDHPVVSDERAVAALGQAVSDGASVGTQLHPWVNPPLDEVVCPENSFPGNLPRALEAAKLDTLTRAIERAFGEQPMIYRAGRYGIGPNTATLLVEAGYRIDSSMRSRYDYSAQTGPDFRAIGNDGFWLDEEAQLAELPLTTVFTGAARRGGEALYRAIGRLPRGRGIFARTGLLARVALTPEDMPLADAMEAVRISLGEGVLILNFSFHSPSLVPGHTPYVRDAGELRDFWYWWDEILGLLARSGYALRGRAT